jgi:hypothetical protein
MASTKPVKTGVKMKTSRKHPADITSKSLHVNGNPGEIKTEVSIKQPAGTVCAVMSLPAPTGQPPKPPGKSPRIADRAATPYKSVKKRKAVETA